MSLVYDMPELEYHAAPGIGSTGLKRLLHAPAVFRHYEDHPEPHKASYDLGHVVHGLLLGTGLVVEVIDAPDWKTKAAQDAKKSAYAAGSVPMLTHEYAEAETIRDKVLEHPAASLLLGCDGDSEASMFWTDEATGAPCKGRFDRLAHAPLGLVPVDVKTTAKSAAAREWGRAVANYGYHTQASHYLTGLAACTDDDTPRPFIHIVVETTAPYLVAVHQLDAEAIAIGGERAAEALRIWRECTDAGRWPGHPDDITPVTLPRWAA